MHLPHRLRLRVPRAARRTVDPGEALRPARCREEARDCGCGGVRAGAGEEGGWGADQGGAEALEDQCGREKGGDGYGHCGGSIFAVRLLFVLTVDLSVGTAKDG